MAGRYGGEVVGVRAYLGLWMVQCVIRTVDQATLLPPPVESEPPLDELESDFLVVVVDSDELELELELSVELEESLEESLDLLESVDDEELAAVLADFEPRLSVL